MNRSTKSNVTLKTDYQIQQAHTDENESKRSQPNQDKTPTPDVFRAIENALTLIPGETRLTTTYWKNPDRSVKHEILLEPVVRTTTQALLIKRPPIYEKWEGALKRGLQRDSITSHQSLEWGEGVAGGEEWSGT
jgi:hypothetical protein